MGAMLSGFLQGVAGKLGPEMERRHADEEALKATKRQALLKAMTMPDASPQERQMYWEEYQKTLSHAKPIKELAGKANQILGHVFKHTQPQGAPSGQAPQESQAGQAPTARDQAAQMLQPPSTQAQAAQSGGKKPFDYASVMGKVGQASDLEAQREDARKLKLFQAEEDIRTRGTVATERAKRDDREQFAKGHLKPGTPEYDEFIATGKWPTSTKPHNMREVLFTVPGSQELHVGWADPQNPTSGVIDTSTGEHREFGTYSQKDRGLSLAQERAKYWGPFGNYYRAAKAQGLGEEAAMAQAGEMVFKEFGVRMGRQEQVMAIDASLSGIGGRPDIPKLPSSQAPKAAPSSAERPARTPAAVRKLPAPPTRVPHPLGMSGKEQEDSLYYLSTLMGGVKNVPKAAQVRVMNGQRAIARVMGGDPMTVAAELATVPATAKQLGETIQRAGAIQRLSNTIEKHGAILKDVAKNVQQTDSPLLNKPVREWKRKLAGSPELKRFNVAINELQREYAYLTAGGAQSRAMLPVHTSESMEKILSDDSTLAEIVAAVDQIHIGATTEQEAMQKTVQDLKDSLRTGKVGTAAAGGAANQVLPPPASAPGTAEEYLKSIGR